MSITKDVTTDEKWREEVLESPGGLKGDAYADGGHAGGAAHGQAK